MMVDMEFVDSSNIEAIGYDADARELHVRFVESGATYIYSDVDAWVFEEFRSAPSKGSYFNRVLKTGYAYRMG